MSIGDNAIRLISGIHTSVQCEITFRHSKLDYQVGECARELLDVPIDYNHKSIPSEFRGLLVLIPVVIQRHYSENLTNFTLYEKTNDRIIDLYRNWVAEGLWFEINVRFDFIGDHDYTKSIKSHMAED